jgi:4-hydroxybenzoate polyprenyltransferase
MRTAVVKLAQHRVRDTFSPWWRPVLWFTWMTIGLALLNTYDPGMRGGPFLKELWLAAILATFVVAGSAALFALLDWRDRRGEARQTE